MICTGYVIDYASDITLTVCLLNDKLTLQQEEFWEFFDRVLLSCCIFAAYIILLKTFLGYQN